MIKKRIALSPEMLMKVLYAHTLAVSILNFSLHPSFTMLEEFRRYFNLYWSYKIVEIEQFGDYPEAVGHPSGHLERIRYLGRGGGGSTSEQCVKLQRLWECNQDWYLEVNGMKCEHNDKTVSYLSGTEANWSSADVDAPYTWCWERDSICSCIMEIENENSDVETDCHEYPSDYESK